MERLKNAVKQFKLRDFLAPFIFVLLLIPSWIFRLINKIRGRQLWLVTESGEARDNGYHFYKYIRENHPEDFCFYAIKPSSAGHDKVKKLGNVIKYDSLRHWLYYMSANLNISSQKSGNPCPIFWYFIHVTLGLYRNRVFLQHGITKDDSKWIYYNKTKFKYFLCGAKREYDYILKKFGYKKENLILAGFPRWDNLKDISSAQKEKSILIMPTWRNWLGGDKNNLFEINDFEKTNFFKHWNELLNDEKLINFAEKNKVKIYFYPHINMQKFIGSFKIRSKNIEIVTTDQDIQDYFNKCSLMVTDYSSVAFDFAYLGKPVIYYQFDEEEYRKKQLQKGYFDYRKDGFGPVAESEEDVLRKIIDAYINGLSDEYKKRFGRMFSEEARGNSMRVYNALRHKKSEVKINDDAKMSVIVPAYNAGLYIDRCLNHLINQTYQNVEILVIDDGSEDDTINIVEGYAKSDSRVRLIKQKHGGPNIARAKGIKAATGKYVMFLDADDFVVEQAVAKIMKAFSSKNVDAVRFGGRRFPGGDNFNEIDSKRKIFEHSDVEEILLTTYRLNNLCVQAYKMENVKNIKAFDLEIIFGEDLLANLEIHKNTQRMLVMGDLLYCYCDNPNSTTRNVSRKSILSKIADREYVSNELIKYALINVIDSNLKNKTVYAQIKMVRDSILEVAKIRDYAKQQFIKDFKKILPRDYFTDIDLGELKKYMKTLCLVEKVKNYKIVLAILTADYDYIWKYISVYNKCSKLVNRGKK